MVVGFTTTYGINAYHSHVASSNPVHCEVLNAKLCDKVCQWVAPGRCVSPDTLVSSTNETSLHNITEILLKVVLNAIAITEKERLFNLYSHYKCYMPYSSTLSSSIYILFVFYCSFLWLNFAISRKCISKHIIKQVLLIKFQTVCFILGDSFQNVK